MRYVRWLYLVVVAGMMGLWVPCVLADNVTITDFVDPVQVLTSTGVKIGIILASVVGLAIACYLVFMLVKFLRRGVGR